jgi:Tol biopolymer transport system component
LGGIIVGNGLNVTSTGVLSVTSNSSLNQLNKLIYKRVSGASSEIWMANYDGTNNVRINISLPSGIVFNDDMLPTLSPNGQKIFFTAGTSTRGDLFSCNVDGSNIIKIVDKGGASNNIILGGAY